MSMQLSLTGTGKYQYNLPTLENASRGYTNSKIIKTVFCPVGMLSK